MRKTYRQFIHSSRKSLFFAGFIHISWNVMACLLFEASVQSAASYESLTTGHLFWRQFDGRISVTNQRQPDRTRHSVWEFLRNLVAREGPGSYQWNLW